MSDESISRLKATKRNDACPCGSGRKYKKCHWQQDEAALHAAKKAETAAEAAVENDGGAEGGGGDDTKQDITAPSVERPHPRQTKPARGQGKNVRAKNLPRRKAI